MASRSRDIARNVRHARTHSADELGGVLRRYSEALPPLQGSEDFGAAFDLDQRDPAQTARS